MLSQSHSVNTYRQRCSCSFKARSHCATWNCDLFLLAMGCIGAGDVSHSVNNSIGIEFCTTH